MTLVYPAHWGVAIRGAHGSYSAPCPMFCFVGLLSAIREIFFRFFAQEGKIQQNAQQNAETREFSVKTREKRS